MEFGHMDNPQRVLLVISDEPFPQALLDSVSSLTQKSVLLFEVSEDSPPKDITAAVFSPSVKGVQISFHIANVITGMLSHQVYNVVLKK
jgi:hypothetical protein